MIGHSSPIPGRQRGSPSAWSGPDRPVPILTKPAHVRNLPALAQAQFELERRCTDLYDLCYETIPAPGREWRTGPVVWEGRADESF